MTRSRFVVFLALAVLAAEAVPADAGRARFPDRPLRYIVPFPPGGSTDVVARIVAAPLGDVLGANVVIDNRGGAGGTVGAEIAAHAPADGYTLFACNIASLAVSPALYKKLGYDPVRGFAPIGLIGSTPNSLVVNPSVPSTSVAEFIALAKSRPGQINYASPGIGTSPQLSMELFKKSAGVDLVHVAYRGAGPAVADLMGNHVQAMFATMPSVIGPVRAGKLRMLGVTSLSRFPDLPNVPTIAESGMPGFEVVSWQGLCTPAGVSSAVLGKLRGALSAALDLPATKQQLAAQGQLPTPMTAEKFAAYIRAERAKWAKVVKEAGIDPQ